MEEDIKYLKSQEAYEMYFRGNPRLEKIVNGFINRIHELEEKLKGKTDNTNKLIEVTNLYLNSIPTALIKEKIEEADKKILEYETYKEKGKETDVEYYDFIASSAEKKVIEELLNTKM